MVATPTTGLAGNSYATVAEADTYLENSLRAAANWESLEEESKARALLTATSMLERQCWVGTRTNSSQTLDWPRTGVAYKTGTPVDENTVPTEVISATIELAYELTQDAALETAKDTGSNDKKYKAGSVEIEFFRPGGSAQGVDGITRFPFIIMEFIRQFLQGGGISRIGGVSAFGTNNCSEFTDTPDRREPLA